MAPDKENKSRRDEKPEDTEKFIMISLEDEKSKSVAEVLSSKTCKKILGFLAESSSKGSSQKDISSALGIPMNTMDYNMRKLLDSGFIQKRKNFFWSKKGKKISMYEISNKSIVISPKKSRSSSDKFKSLLPAFIITAAGTFAAWVYQKLALGNTSEYVNAAQKGNELMAAGTYAAGTPSAPAVNAVASAGNATQNITAVLSSGSNLSSMMSMPLWAWFLLGALVGILIISIVNWKKL